MSSERTDAAGRAYAGSQRHIQTYVNVLPEVLNDAVRRALPELAEAAAAIEWVSPLAEDGYREYRDREFLAALRLSRFAPALAEFWPRKGPQWDALAGLRSPPPSARTSGSPESPSGVLLVEAKSYPEEMVSGGCRAAGVSRAKIERALQDARAWSGAAESDWCGSLYQFANRLAHVYFLRERADTPAWLVNVCFVNDPRRPTGEEEWRTDLARAAVELGFDTDPPRFTAHVFLPAP